MNLKDVEYNDDGLIIDCLSGSLLKDTPEEKVRQRFIKILQSDYGYPKDCILREIPIQSGSKIMTNEVDNSPIRADIVIYKNKKAALNKDQGNILFVVECKQPNVTEGYAQLVSYIFNTSAIGGTDRPVYFTNGGVPAQTTYRMAGTNAAATTGLTYSNNLDTGIWYVNGITAASNPSNPGNGIIDGVIYAEKYDNNWIHEIYGDYRTGQIAVRGKNNGTWQDWRKILDSSNYTDYTVTKTGSGASGSWGISITGNAATATAFSANKSVTLTGDVTGSASSTGGWSIATTLANSGATAGSYGDSVAQTPGYGATFKVPYITVDAKGRITAISEHTVKIPESDNTNTLNTAGSTNSTSKLFLIGATSQAANPTTNSYQYTYTNNGLLSALKVGLNLNGTEKAHLEWNNDDQTIDFVFA